MDWLAYDTLDSTNDEAKRLLSAGALRGTTLVTARQQTAGRGTQGRCWVSPRDIGLYMSLIHLPTPDACLPLSPILTLSAGVACADTLYTRYGLPVRLKPVNDLYLAGGKLGGILTETLAQGERVLAVITGVGINLREGPRPLGPEAAAKPISLAACLPPQQAAALAEPTHGPALARALAEAIDTRHRQVFGGDTATIQARWQALALSPG